jgi:hypothetical protein
MAASAWPTSVPVRVSLVTSGWQPAEDVQTSAASAPALTATVTTTTPSSSHQVPDMVRSLVHSARSTVSHGARPRARGHGTRPRPG